MCVYTHVCVSAGVYECVCMCVNVCGVCVVVYVDVCVVVEVCGYV